MPFVGKVLPNAVTVKLKVLVDQRMRAGGIDVAEQGQIGLSGDEHEEVRQEVAAAGDAQRLFAIEGNEGVITVGVLQIDVLKCAPAQAAVNREGAQVGGGGIGIHHAERQCSVKADVGGEAANDPIRAVRPVPRVIEPHAEVERINAVVERVC